MRDCHTACEPLTARPAAVTLAQTRAEVESLRQLLQPPDGPAAIEHRSVPATAAAAIGAVVDRADALVWWQGALGELRATIRAQGLHATGPSGGVFASELLQQDRGPATVFIPVPGRVHPIGRVTSLVIPAAELAIISHHGSLAERTSATPSSARTPPRTRSASTGRCASTICAAPGTRPTRRNGGPRLAGPSSAPTPPVLTGKPCCSLRDTTRERVASACWEPSRRAPPARVADAAATRSTE